MNSDESVKQKKTEDNTFGSNEVYEHGKHPNSLANLKPFPKGVSGNPMGRKHRFENLAKELKLYADERVTDYYGEDMGYTNREGVLQMIWNRALKGEIKYVQMLAWLGCLDE
tara:strand:+ start:1225 stop:1560 length:336 start_codon:yes stop_codon:yes gene_type:complete